MPVTVVTGASDGIGRALAHEFARDGHALMIVARNADRLEETARQISTDHAVPVHVQACDLSTAQGCADVALGLERHGAYADYLVNNAGFGLCSAFADTDHGDLMALIDLNMRAATDLARRFLPGMLERRSGGILNVSSLGGYLPGPYQAAYYASKSYLISLTEGLAEEARGSGVRIAVLAPGPVKTGFHERMGGERSHYIRFQGVMHAEEVARIGYTNFRCGQKVIVPGAINMATALAVRLIPHMFLTPFAAWLLRPRKEDHDA